MCRGLIQDVLETSFRGFIDVPVPHKGRQLTGTQHV